MKFLLPQGIGDSVWALTKIEDVARQEGADSIEVALNCTQDGHYVQSRALDFVRQFAFVSKAQMLVTHIHPDMTGPPVDKDGRYIYIPDGWKEIRGEKYFVMMPNHALERGIRLEDWLPQYKINWNILDQFCFCAEEIQQADQIKKDLGDYCVFYMGPMAGNTEDGHNRDSLWTPEDWAALGKAFTEQGLKVVLVGASYDQMYWVMQVFPLVEEQGWLDLVGATEIGQTLAIIKQAKFVISYQSGIGIVAEYMGIPTGIFWRPDGNSISSSFYLSFDERMNGGWSPPSMIESGKHMALYYSRHSADWIVEEVKRRGW